MLPKKLFKIVVSVFHGQNYNNLRNNSIGPIIIMK